MDMSRIIEKRDGGGGRDEDSNKGRGWRRNGGRGREKSNKRGTGME